MSKIQDNELLCSHCTNRNNAMIDSDTKQHLAAILEKKRANQSEIDAIDAAIAEVAPVPRITPESVDAFASFAPSDPMKPGVRTSEMWIALALPIIVGAVVELGWLSEQAATQLGLVGGGSYVLGRSVVKSVMEWRKR